jgi:hypothetical protein
MFELAHRHLLACFLVVTGASLAHAEAVNPVVTTLPAAKPAPSTVVHKPVTTSPPAKATPAPPPAAPAADACAAKPAAPTRVRTLVLDWKSDEAHRTLASSLVPIVAREASAIAGLQVLSGDDVRAALNHEANQQLLGCNDDQSCLAELTAALDATLLVTGTLGQTTDGATVLSLSLVNTRALVVVNRVVQPWRGEAKSLPDVVRVAAQQLLLDAKERPPGSLRVVGVPKDSRVFVDDIDHSDVLLAGELHDVSVGVHEVRVQAPGKLPCTVAVVVQRAAATTAEPILVDEPLAGLLWVGAGVGASVVAVGVAATVLYFTGKGDAAVSATVPHYTLHDVETLRSTP